MSAFGSTSGSNPRNLPPPPAPGENPKKLQVRTPTTSVATPVYTNMVRNRRVSPADWKRRRSQLASRICSTP